MFAFLTFAGVLIQTWGPTSLAVQPPPPAFDAWDQNRDGVISREEFERGIKQMRQPAPGSDNRLPRRRRGAPEMKRGPAGPGPGELERRIDEAVHRAIQRVMAERERHIRQLIRDAIGQALRERRGGGREQAPFPPPPGPPPMRGPDWQIPTPPPGPPPADRGWFAPKGDRRGAGPADPRPRRGRFAEMDRNRDGFLTPDEVAIPPERFGQIDRNNDGRIDREEWRQSRPNAGRGGRPEGPPPAGPGPARPAQAGLREI